MKQHKRNHTSPTVQQTLHQEILQKSPIPSLPDTEAFQIYSTIVTLRELETIGATGTSVFDTIKASRYIEFLLTTQLYFLEPSALAMAEATLAQDPWLPDFPPVESIWLQPEGTLTFHSVPVKGIALFQLFKDTTPDNTILNHQGGTYVCTRLLRVKREWRSRKGRKIDAANSPKWLFPRLLKGERYSCLDKPT